MKQLLFTLFCLFAYSSLQAQAVPTDELYGVGIWNADSLGNHRVIVSVDKPDDAVLATIDWRRRDLNPEAKNLIVVDAATGTYYECMPLYYRPGAGRGGFPAADCSGRILYLLSEECNER